MALEVAEAPTSTSTSEEFVIPEAPPLEGDDSLTATAPASSPEDAPLDGTAVGDPFCQAEPPPTVFCQAEPPPTVEGDGGMVAAPVPLPDFSMPTVNTSQAHERSRSRLHPGRTSHAIAPVRCMRPCRPPPLCGIHCVPTCPGGPPGGLEDGPRRHAGRARPARGGGDRREAGTGPCGPRAVLRRPQGKERCQSQVEPGGSECLHGGSGRHHAGRKLAVGCSPSPVCARVPCVRRGGDPRQRDL